MQNPASFRGPICGGAVHGKLTEATNRRLQVATYPLTAWYSRTMFEIRNSADYYAMLVEDLDEFMKQPHSSRCAIHCAITAYHMHEWVWHDWLKDRDDIKAALGLTDLNSFLHYLRGSVWLG